MGMTHTHDTAKRLVGAFALAVGIAYALHQGSLTSAAFGFADEIFLGALAVVRRVL